MLEQLRRSSEPHLLHVADYVRQRRDLFIEWPRKSLCFMNGCVRIKYHAYSPEQKQALREARISADSRSNGPAIMSFLLADGRRPARQVRGKSWSVHHIYDGKFPAPGRTTAHAVKDPALFTEAAGLVAVHPVADALADEVPFFTWLLRKEAFERFGFDPDGVFANEGQNVGRISAI